VLSVDQIAAILWRRRVTFLVTFVLVVAGAAAAIALMPKVYSTSAYLYVSSGSASGSDYEQVQINQVITKTFAELLQTRNIADEVAGRIPWDDNGAGLQNAVEISPVESTQLIRMTAEASTARRAQVLANTYAEVFIEQADQLLGTRSATTSVRLAERAPLITNQARPRPKLYMLVGAIIALLVAAGGALLRHRTDQRLELDSSSTEIYGLPLIGRISATASPELVLSAPPEQGSLRDRATQEEYRLLLANLSFVNHGRRPRTIAVVSAGQGEGKSTTAVSLGHAAAEMGIRTLLVDADMRRPRLSRALAHEVGPTGGLSTFLAPDEPLAISEVAVDTGPLSVVAAGPVPVNPTALLGSDEFADFVDRAARVYDLVIIDTPPISVGADASLVSAKVEGVVLVIDVRSTRRTVLLRAIDQLERVQAHVLGAVVNRANRDTTAYYYAEDAISSNGGGVRRRTGDAAAAADEV
jgi:capsular exopolysaccharide synthesis family protein